jgi:hypothetical protein
MGDEGEPEVEEAICPRDAAVTRLRCTDCRKPICPRCFMRTPVGFKCQSCAAPVPAAVALSRRSRPGRPLQMAAIVALVVMALGTWALLGRSGDGEPASDGDVGVTPRSTAEGAVAGTGRALDGKEWTLEARRDGQGRICTRLRLNIGNSSPESCDTPPSQRPFGPVRPRGALGPGQPTFQSWGIVSDRVVRVRATAEDGTITDADVFGNELGLGVRFFMSYVDRLHGVTFVAFGPDGEELGRSDPPPIPPPRGR